MQAACPMRVAMASASSAASAAWPAGERERLAAAPQAFACHRRVTARSCPGQRLGDLRKPGLGLGQQREHVAAGGLRAPQPQHLGWHDRQVGQIAEPGGGFSQPSGHVAGHGLPVQQPCGAAGLARLPKQPPRAAEMPLGAGEVAGGQVDDGGCGKGLAACTWMILGLGDSELGEFLAAGHADRSGFEESQIGQNPGAVRRVVASLQRGFEVGPGAGEHASAAPRFGAGFQQVPAREAGRLQGQPGVCQAQRLVVGKASEAAGRGCRVRGGCFVRVAAGQQVAR